MNCVNYFLKNVDGNSSYSSKTATNSSAYGSGDETVLSAENAKLLDTIENQTNTNNEKKIIEVAETEINNMQQIKDGLDGCAYLIWGRREWNRA